LIRLGKDRDAEAAFENAAVTIEAIAGELKTDSLIRSFISASSVLEVFHALGRHPKIAPI
jgi:hypothetical protein